MGKRLVAQSRIEMNNIVLPANTNGFGNLMGGQLIYWMDIAGALSARKHSRENCMTVSIDSLIFKSPIILNDSVKIISQITRCFNSTMEIFIKVFGEKTSNERIYEANEAFFTFIALNDYGKPITIEPIFPETTEEIELYDSALKRREQRLINAQKLTPEDSVYFKGCSHLQ